MIQITNGQITLSVTNGAYKDTYKSLGFEPVEQEDIPEIEEETPAQGEDSDEGEEDFAELLEKPISSWNKEEIKAFVDAKGIDTADAKNVGEVKELIKAWLEENEE